MSGSKTKSGNDCETSRSHNNPDITFETEGKCNDHCKLKKGKNNSITMELIIENHSYFTYYFDSDVNSPGSTKFYQLNLPNCDSISVNDSDTFDWEIYHNSGQKGKTDTLNVETNFTKRAVYCPDRAALNETLHPEITFDN